MRAVITAALCSGCTSILGISDPKPADGDGGPDMMVDSNIDAPPPCTTSVTFAGAEVVSAIGKNGTGFGIGRFNNGLEEDIIVATGADSTILFGDRTGAFAGTIQTVPTAAGDVAIGDWDIIASADDDFAFFAKGGTSVIARRQNRALTPPVEAEQPLAGPFGGVQRVIGGDFGGTGNDDLLVYDSTDGTRVYQGSGTPGDFIKAASAVAPPADELILVAQIDGAARPDAIFLNGNMVKISLQSNTAFGALAGITSLPNSKGIAVGKFDGDAFLDIVVSTAQGLQLLRQVSATPGTFQLHGVISPLQSAAPMQVADLNDDGRDDIVVANAVILQCAPLVAGGPGVFTQVEQLNATAPVLFRDVTGNAKPDLIRVEGSNIKVRVR